MKQPGSIDDLAPAPYNPRKISDRASKALAKSLERFGDISGIVWNATTGNLVCGHQRVEQLRGLGAKMVDGQLVLGDQRWPVRVVEMTPEEEKAANVSANNPSIAGEFNDDLRGLLAEIGGEIGEVEFSGLALDDLLVSLPEPGRGVEQDEVPEPPKVAVTKPGDVWTLGRHRVVCGDAAEIEHSQTAGLVFTSPPYEQQRDYGGSSDVSDWGALMRGVFTNLPAGEETQVLVNLGLIHRDCEWVPYWNDWIEWMRSEGWRRFGWYVWDQGPGLPGHWQGRLAPSFEFVFHFNRSSVKPNKWVAKLPESIRRPSGSSLRSADGENRARSSNTAWRQPNKIPDSVIREYREKAAGQDHPAKFSVAFAGHVLRCWGGTVCDPFLGSGTTLIAAEQLDRTCYGIEIEPRYVDVVVERWENLTGGKARRGSP